MKPLKQKENTMSQRKYSGSRLNNRQHMSETDVLENQRRYPQNAAFGN